MIVSFSWCSATTSIGLVYRWWYCFFPTWTVKLIGQLANTFVNLVWFLLHSFIFYNNFGLTVVYIFFWFVITIIEFVVQYYFHSFTTAFSANLKSNPLSSTFIGSLLLHRGYRCDPGGVCMSLNNSKPRWGQFIYAQKKKPPGKAYSLENEQTVNNQTPHWIYFRWTNLILLFCSSIQSHFQ